MASSMAIFAASRGMQAGNSMANAYKQQLFAKLQAESIQLQMSEIDRRANIEIGQVFERGERVKSEQTAAFIQGGVEIEGSAMDVLADTMANAAEAAFIRRSEADYNLKGLSMQQAGLEEQASDANFIFNVAAGGADAYAGYMQDEFQTGRRSMRNRRPAQGVA
jgi:hypothetical protein